MRWEDEYAQEIFLVHSIGDCRGPAAAGNASWAATVGTALHLLSSIAIPVATGNATGGMFSFDISFVDQSTGDYYLADRSNKAVDRQRRVDRQADRPEQRPRAVRGVRARAFPTGHGLMIVPVPTASWPHTPGSL